MIKTIPNLPRRFNIGSCQPVAYIRVRANNMAYLAGVCGPLTDIQLIAELLELRLNL